jgi:hypothetical protein
VEVDEVVMGGQGKVDVVDAGRQLEAWVAGESLHSHGPRQETLCCPDFSCCRPELLAPEDERRAFAAASYLGRARLRAVFTRRLVDLLGKTVPAPVESSIDGSTP